MKPKIVFADSFFDSFDGTEEELQELLDEINRLVETGEIFDIGEPIKEGDLTDEEVETFKQMLDGYDPETYKKSLN